LIRKARDLINTVLGWFADIIMKCIDPMATDPVEPTRMPRHYPDRWYDKDSLIDQLMVVIDPDEDTYGQVGRVEARVGPLNNTYVLRFHTSIAGPVRVLATSQFRQYAQARYAETLAEAR
jgi:hypothetical protein